MGRWPSRPGSLLWPQPSPHGPRAPAAEASGHTHCLLVPARLAGILEAGKLAIPGGPTVLVDDALLRRRRERLPQRKGSSRPLCPGRAKPHFIPGPTGSGGSSRVSRLPVLPSPAGSSSSAARPRSMLARTARLGVCPPGCHPVHTMASACSPPPHIPGGEHRDSGPVSKMSRRG